MMPLADAYAAHAPFSWWIAGIQIAFVVIIWILLWLLFKALTDK